MALIRAASEKTSTRESLGFSFHHHTLCKRGNGGGRKHRMERGMRGKKSTLTCRYGTAMPEECDISEDSEASGRSQ